MPKLKWNNWVNITTISLDKTLLVETLEGYRTAVFTSKKKLIMSYNLIDLKRSEDGNYNGLAMC